MIIEVIGISVEDVIAAEQYGANRIELCAGMPEGGTTPSYGLIKNAVAAVDIPINVIIRPHSKSFHYNEQDIQTMLTDIEMVKEVGANGVVIGALTKDGKVDIDALERLLDAAAGLEVVFHRAFDFVDNQVEALEVILRYKQITGILTSGGGDTHATDNVAHITTLIERTRDTALQIMPGSGMRVETLQAFYDLAQPEAIHFGTGVRKDNTFNEAIDKSKIEQVRKIVGKL